ncbi:type II secretion system F family protein [Cognatilysobacter segetis]|uniref:type II secretion system F family protein n=1 Tax=Cognatilysobacter segetis TaxID=2492394 RepID=UPI0010614FDF|nr:type II secretion system F family protein [Lysobacter segetis]
MRRFAYQAINTEGRPIEGVLRAPSDRAAARQLERRGLTVVTVDEEGVAKGRLARQRSLGHADVMLALQELSTMLLSGVAIAESVQSQSLSSAHPRVREAFAVISRELQRGQAFSTALVGSGLPMPTYVGQLAKAGEMTGELGRALADAAAQMDYEHRLRAEMRNAMIYPAVLVAAGALAVSIMFVFVVPKFATLLKRADDLPFLAWAVLGTGVWFRSHFVLALGGLAAVIGGAVVAFRNPGVRERALEGAARLPIIGPWIVESDTARWAKVLAALLGNRVPLLRALELARGGVAIPSRRAHFDEVARAVRGGSGLADALEDHEVMTATAYNLVRVGERSGRLAAMLGSLAKLYEESGRSRMKRVLILMEPAAILVIGSVIGTIILGVILAITSANDLAI